MADRGNLALEHLLKAKAKANMTKLKLIEALKLSLPGDDVDKWVASRLPARVRREPFSFDTYVTQMQSWSKTTRIVRQRICV